jgi:ketosteroid isomerase-like protein
MRKDELESLTKRVLEAWTSQDVEAVVGCYTDDLEYLDPNTRGEVNGADAMRRYLTKLFEAWEMTWTLREAHISADDENIGSFGWHATFRRPGGGEQAEADGMDLVVLEGDRIKRNEVYFDRSVLVPLLAEPAEASA